MKILTTIRKEESFPCIFSISQSVNLGNTTILNEVYMSPINDYDWFIDIDNT